MLCFSLNQWRTVYIGIVIDQLFIMFKKCIFPETCVNLAKFIVEDDQVKKKKKKELHMEIPESV